MTATAVEPAPDSWGRIGRVAGYLAGTLILVGTVLYLLDATDLLAASPEFRPTSAGFEVDTANWYVAFFHRQHEILWDIAVRDTIIPIGFVALMVLSLATANAVGRGRPAAQLMALFFVLGGLFNIVNDLLYLSELNYWRHTGWTADPPGPMVAVGRATEAIDTTTQYFERAGYVVLAAALLCLGLLCRTSPWLPRWLGIAAYVEAAGMFVLVAGLVLDAETLFRIGGLATGVVLGPLVAVALGRALASAHVLEPDRAPPSRA